MTFKESTKGLNDLWRLNLKKPNPPNVVLPPPVEDPQVPAIEERAWTNKAASI